MAATQPSPVEADLILQRRESHALLDALPDEKLAAVRGLLAVLVEPIEHLLASAPIEDQELTPETIASLDRSRASLARGEGVTHQEVLHEFGL